ncbi:ATP-binding protein [Rhizobium mongolense]|uniref:DNA-binding CsgD family transcriptional regulator/tetratricopeptide (TPR) repeat protein n=1 Tax=Rhizobium mongolense TaxID=57676 RepID=A0A7W6RTX3_9HYPH|nr:LuxR family transcriptional regulator [Rhizobium mongolense]MBB4277878.1 DNA-binding CsgD family transcriptional regulator/tetratricopeptide (TPR) repeat protein [Rhizobium mongolense]
MLLDREGPLETLLSAMRSAAAGHGSTVLLEGEAGIGKTSLLREFAEHADKGCRVLWGWCEALFTPCPLGPMQDIGQLLDPRVAALLDQAAPPERLFPALLNVLQHASVAIVLIFEDVHWADNATLDLIKYLGRRISLLPAVLVLSLRSDEIGADHPLTHVLGDLPSASVIRIALEPLSPEAVTVLAEQAGRCAADLYRVTEGNPFFITELLASGEAEPGRVPDSIRDAVWTRLSRLTAGERKVLEVISIVPGSVEPWLIRSLLGVEAEALVDQCVARGLLRQDDQGAVMFRHELARQATLDRLPPSVQRSLHEKVEAAISQLPTTHASALLSRRIHHAVGADDGARVLELAPQAAAHAVRLGAHREAASHLATALRYVAQATPELAAQLYEDWAYEAGLALLVYEPVIEAHHRAIAIWRELGRTDKIGPNLCRLSRLHWRRGEGRPAEDYADQAVREMESLPPGSELAMAYSTRSQLHMLHYRFDAAIDWGLRAISLADQLGEIETRVHALNNVGTALLFADRPGGRERLEESLALALEHGFHDHAARAYTNFAECAAVSKDFVLAERLLAEGIAFATRHDLDSAAQYLLGRQAQLRMEQGRFREAETVAQGVMSLEGLPMVMHLPALTVLGTVRVRLGEPGSLALLQQALLEGLATGELQRIVPVRLALAEAAWLDGDDSAAHEQLNALVGMDLDNFRTWDFGELAVWWQRCGMAKPLPAPKVKIPLARSSELRGNTLAAAREWDRLGLPYEAALALMQVRGADAGPALARAVTTFESLEARPAAALARKQAQRLGVAGQLPKTRRGPYGAARRHPLGLTWHEQQVLALIAAGMSNKEAAQRLSRSPRTIEHQVSAVLGKFNAANRMEVLLRLRGEPWLL